jgi:hypothetical protein
MLPSVNERDDAIECIWFALRALLLAVAVQNARRKDADLIVLQFPTVIVSGPLFDLESSAGLLQRVRPGLAWISIPLPRCATARPLTKIQGLVLKSLPLDSISASPALKFNVSNFSRSDR